jgi:hypothetical protein
LLARTVDFAERAAAEWNRAAGFAMQGRSTLTAVRDLLAGESCAELGVAPQAPRRASGLEKKWSGAARLRKCRGHWRPIL